MAGPTTVTPTVKSFKQPFKAVAQLSHKTGKITKSIDPAIGKTIDFFSNSYAAVKTKVDKAPKINPYLLIALGLIVSGILSFFLIIPAIIFFPITILLGIGTAFTFIALFPVTLVLGWILISSAPVQDKVVLPTLDYALENKKVAKFLLKE